MGNHEYKPDLELAWIYSNCSETKTGAPANSRTFERTFNSKMIGEFQTKLSNRQRLTFASQRIQTYVSSSFTEGSSVAKTLLEIVRIILFSNHDQFTEFEVDLLHGDIG